MKAPGGEERVTSYNGREFSFFTRGPDPPGYPEREILDEYVLEPGKPAAAGDYAHEYGERKKAFLDFCLANPAPKNLKAAYYELPRIAAGRAAHEESSKARWTTSRLGRTAPTSSFTHSSASSCNSRIRKAYRPVFARGRRRSSSGSSIGPTSRERIPSAPGRKNHQILYASAAYILGNAWPRKNLHEFGYQGE